jgi:imidazole glycerol-phosphate synthase subunit HisF
MLATRLMPCLLMSNGALVKTVKFKNPTYVGDPVNAVRIFNQKEVDELILLDIDATTQHRGIDYETLEKLVSECFMPICYGGGVQSIKDMRRLFNMGIEKVCLGTSAFDNPDLIRQAAKEFGNQAIVVSVDVKKGLLGGYSVRTHHGTKDTKMTPVVAAKYLEDLGAGEIILYSIDRDGTWSGFDLKLIEDVVNAVRVPVVATGGAGSLDDIKVAVQEAGASAVAIGSMAVFQGKDLGVLIKFPSRKDQDALLA